MPERPDLRSAFLAATDHVIAIVSLDEVGAGWADPSALSGWRLGGLVAHLASQPVTVASLLASEPASDPIPLVEHYARAAWVTASLDDDVNVAIREGSDEQARAGREEVIAGLVAARDMLPELLARQTHDRAVLIPWQGWSLALDDFLVGRMMEIVVHGEDVAASVGVPAPVLPPAVLDPVLGLLAHLAVRRHGQAAVVSALTRSERAPATISAF